MVSMLPISFQLYAVAARQKTVRQFLKRYSQDYREILTVLIQRGMDRGEFRPMRAKDVAIAIIAHYKGPCAALDGGPGCNHVRADRRAFAPAVA
jgi:tetracycline repressor-like protein